MTKTKRKDHRLEFCKSLSRMRCIRCGELRLKNDASRRALKKPCRGQLWVEDEEVGND